MLSREELKMCNNNVMTVMENRIMMIVGDCDRQQANFIANMILDLDTESERLLSEENMEDQ